MNTVQHSRMSPALKGRWRSLTLIALVFMVCLAAAAPAEAATWRSCGSVVFEPQTEWMASSIRAYRTSCSTARAIARRTKWRFSGSFHAKGFRCRGAQVKPTGLPYARWNCTRGGKRVRFYRS